MARAERGAVSAWGKMVFEVVRAVAVKKNGAPFTTDDVWAEMKEDTHDRRALGPVMTRAERAGIIEMVDGHRNSSLVSAHARKKQLWRLKGKETEDDVLVLRLRRKDLRMLQAGRINGNIRAAIAGVLGG